MNKHYGNVVLVTGASSGIGKAVAEYLVQKGYIVYGTSRKAQDAGKVGGNSDVNSAGNSVKMLQMDVCSEESVKAAVQQVLAAEGELGVVVNNAGIAIAGSVEDTSPAEAYLQINTNFFGMHRVVREVLPAMRKQGRGLIINMSSVAAVFPIPFQSMYVASKAAIEGMSGSLRNELRPFGIKVAMVRPGDTKTGQTDNRIFIKAGGTGSAYSERSKRSIAVMEHDEMNGPDPIVVARVIGKIMERKNPPLCVAVGLQYKLFVFLIRFLPKKFITFVVSKMYEG